MSEQKEFNVSTKIDKLELKSFEVEKSAHEKKLNPDTFTYDYVLDIKIEPSARSIFLHCTSKIFTEKEKINLVGTIISEGNFEVLNIKEILAQFENKIPVTVFSMFVSVLIGSMRGFLIIKAENTPLKGAIMPVINAQSFFSNQTFIAIENLNPKDESVL